MVPSSFTDFNNIKTRGKEQADMKVKGPAG
jgi:hypothetical protein